MAVRFGVATRSGQIDSANVATLAIEFHARTTNAGAVYVGLSGVTSNTGREIPPGEAVTLNFALPDIGRHAGRVLLSGFYVVITGGDKLDWTAIVRDPAA